MHRRHYFPNDRLFLPVSVPPGPQVNLLLACLALGEVLVALGVDPRLFRPPQTFSATVPLELCDYLLPRQLLSSLHFTGSSGRYGE